MAGSSRLRDELTGLHDAALAITAELSLDRVLQKIVDAARTLAGARYAALGVAADDGGLVEFVTSGMAAEEVARMAQKPTGRGLLGELLRAKRPLRIANIAGHPSSCGFPEHHPTMTSFLGAPLILRGRALGSLYLADKIAAPEFTGDDEILIEMLAAQAAVAVENARLFTQTDEALRRKVDELRAERCQLKALLDQKPELDRLKDELVSIISHELRNPLTAIRGRAQLMLRAARRQPDRAEDVIGLEAIDAQVEKLAAMARELLDVSRLRLGMLELHLGSCDLVALGRQAIDQFRAIDEHRVLVIAGQLDRLEGQWDSGRLEQVVFNLLENAKKYSPPDKPITLSISTITSAALPNLPNLGSRNRDTERWALLAVSDEGMGIPPEAQSHLFDRFYRAANAKGRAETGLGLGLYICHEIVSQHGGLIWLESGEGKGSTFYVALPLKNG